MNSFASSPLFRVRIIVSIIAVCFISLLYGAVQRVDLGATEAKVVVSQWPIGSFPQLSQPESQPNITAVSAYVTDEETGAVLYSKNATLQYAPASVTKLMTALIAREAYKPGEVLTISQSPTTDSRRIFFPGEQYTVENLLAAALIQSSNDAAFELSRHMEGGTAEFVRRMNAKAAQLDLVATNFANPNGFDHPEQKITARDLTILSREVLKDSLLRRLIATSITERYDLSGQKSVVLINTHQLVHQDDRISGIKTGTTTEAGQVLVSLAEIDGRTIIISVLGSGDRYADTLSILSWLEQAYIWEESQIQSFSAAVSVLY